MVKVEKEIQGKRNFNKYIIIIFIVLVIIALTVVLLSVFNKKDEKEKIEEGEECKIVRNYISALNNKNSSEAENCMDFTGTEVWKYTLRLRNFSEDNYNQFVNDYENVKGYEVQQEREYFEMKLEKQLEQISKIEVKEIKSVDKLGKNLYAVEAEIYLQKEPKKKDDFSTSSDEIRKYQQEMLEKQEKLEKEMKATEAKMYGISLDKDTNTMIFVVYNNKIISSNLDILF